MTDIKEDWVEAFDKTSFAKGGGACFECCDFEGMYNDLKSFIRTARQEAYDKGKREGVEQVWDDCDVHVKEADQQARKEVIEECLRIIKKSRTLEENIGIGVREETARTQSAVDILTSLKNPPKYSTTYPPYNK